MKQDASEAPAPTAARPAIRWRMVLAAGALAGLGWIALVLLTLKFPFAFYVTAVVPIAAGMYVGRKIEGRPFVHGVIIGATGMLVALLLVVGLVLSLGQAELATIFDPQNGAAVTVAQLLVNVASMMFISLGVFSVYGVWLSFNSHQKNRVFREEMQRRGGTLPRPGRVVNLDDVQALTLPKFAAWVAHVFRQQKFAMDDYRIEKEHVDLFLRRIDADERWLVRCTVQDAVKPGTLLSMDQELRTSEEFVKGVVATSMQIEPKTRTTIKNKSNLEVLDGETLLEIS